MVGLTYSSDGSPPGPSRPVGERVATGGYAARRSLRWGCIACAGPIGRIRALERVVLRFQSGRNRPDGQAPQRRTRLSPVHVRPNLYVGRRSVAGRPNLSDCRPLGGGPEAPPSRHQSRDCPPAGPGFRARRRSRAARCRSGDGVRPGAEPRDHRPASGSQRRNIRAGALRHSHLDHSHAPGLVRLILGLGFIHRRSPHTG